jgi:hypothetical protein
MLEVLGKIFRIGPYLFSEIGSHCAERLGRFGDYNMLYLL